MSDPGKDAVPDGPFSWWCSKCNRVGSGAGPADCQAAHVDHGDCGYLVAVLPPSGRG